ncbi:MAG: glycosyltransferase [Simkaniaceae bacterium]|nr:glycosyltransferase [Simkaniaceae bacterium]
MLIALVGSLGAGAFYFFVIHRPYLTVIGPVDMSDGIGRQSLDLMEALSGEVSIGLIPTTQIRLHGFQSKVHHLLKFRPKRLGKVIFFEDSFGVKGGTAYKKLQTLKNPEQIRIAYSMFESDRIPTEWVPILNYYFDAVVVPDPFFVDVYKNSGVTIPIFEIPLGLNLEDFFQKPLKIKRNTPMVFANLSAALPRKNQLKLIQAFHAAFGNSPDVRLKINSRYADLATKNGIKQAIQDLGLTNVDFTEMVLERPLYVKVFEDIDCYVSLSTGEGFSIQPRESMALGIPAIVTDNTAQSTICKSELVRRVAAEQEIPAYYNWFDEVIGKSYDCSIEDATEALRDVYENYDTYLSKGEERREWVKQYRFSRLKSKYLNLIKPRSVVLGEENQITEEGIVTTSRELYDKYRTLLGVP